MMSDDNPQEPSSARSNSAAAAPDTQKRVLVTRELDRLRHVFNRLSATECAAAKRAQIAELQARKIEAARHEMERDAKVREQLRIEQRDKTVRQHDRVAVMREQRKARAESTRRSLRSQKLDKAQSTKEQHVAIQVCLSESNAGRHDRCVAQHAIIRESEKQSLAAKHQAEQRKRENASLESQRAAEEFRQKEQQLEILREQVEAMERRAQEAKSVELASTGKLKRLTTTSSPTMQSSRSRSRQNGDREGGRNGRGGGGGGAGGGGGDDSRDRDYDDQTD